MKKNTTIALIPARAGSKRVKDKNIRRLGGHPLLAYSILTAKECNLLPLLSTDSEQYAEIGKSYGAQIIMRDENASSDSAGDLEVISHALSEVNAELVAYLRPTTPFRTAWKVLEAIKLMSVPGYDSLRSVEEMSESAWKCFTIYAGILHPLGETDTTDRPNQELERTFHPNGYVDMVRREIVERGSLWGAGRYAFITPRTVEIDTEDDFRYAEWVVQERRIYA